MDQPCEPIGLFNFGWSYLRSAESLQTCANEGLLKVAFDAPIQFLLAHSFELIQKSFIVHHTGNWSELSSREKLGHDLLKCRDRAIQLGIGVEFTEQEQSNYTILAAYSAVPYETRYLKTGAKHSISALPLFLAARKLASAVEPHLAPEKVKNVGLQTLLDPAPDYGLPPPQLSTAKAIELLTEHYSKELAP
ncbi:MAG TPA: hypothetical protein PK970_03610 [Hyphomicrobiaceae bacterium]|nr:hypothetical protein [Hyphomicrobiaceae bacterium]